MSIFVDVISLKDLDLVMQSTGDWYDDQIRITFTLIEGPSRARAFSIRFIVMEMDRCFEVAGPMFVCVDNKPLVL